MPLAGSAGDDAKWRLVGISSYNFEEDCTPSTFYATDVAANVEWLENSSGVDITPCFDAHGVWSPSNRCGSFAEGPLPPTDHPGLFDFHAGPAETTCGAPYVPVLDTTAPTIETATVSRTADGSRAVVSVSAIDDQGVAVVELQLRDGSRQRDEVPPYSFDVTSKEYVSGLVTAIDVAGNESSIVVSEVQASGGCELSRGLNRDAALENGLATLAIGAILSRRRRGRWR